MDAFVNDLPEYLIKEAERIEDNPEKLLALIDLLFLDSDHKVIPS